MSNPAVRGLLILLVLLKCHFSIFFFRKPLLVRDLNSAVMQERENSFHLRYEFLLMGIH